MNMVKKFQDLEKDSLKRTPRIRFESINIIMERIFTRGH